MRDAPIGYLHGLIDALEKIKHECIPLHDAALERRLRRGNRLQFDGASVHCTALCLVVSVLSEAKACAQQLI